MQHLFKRMLSVSLISLLAVALAACGQSNNNSSGTAPASSESASAPSSPAASASAAPSEGSITVEDALGTVVLPKAPEKIVTMEFGFADALVTLGLQPVGVADDDDSALFMDAVKSQLTNYKSVGSRYEPNIELISSLQPDLIIVDLNKHKEAFEQLKGIAPLLVLDDFQADYDQMLKNYMIIAKAVGKEAEGAKRLEEHQAKMDAAKQKSRTPI